MSNIEGKYLVTMSSEEYGTEDFGPFATRKEAQASLSRLMDACERHPIYQVDRVFSITYQPVKEASIVKAQKTYAFTVVINGTGEDADAAWRDAADSFSQDPGDNPTTYREETE